MIAPKVMRAPRSKGAMLRRPHAALAVLAVFLGLALAGCPKPTDGDPQIAISPNIQGRYDIMPGGHGGRPKAPREASVDASAPLPIQQ